MATAWETLVAGSSLPEANSAWDHLNAQEGIGAGSGTGYIKVWTGAAWTLCPVKMWTGSTWETKAVKIFDGSDWQLT